MNSNEQSFTSGDGATIVPLNRTQEQLRVQVTEISASLILPLRESQGQVSDFLVELTATVKDNYTDAGFGLPQLCQTLGLSPSQLMQQLKAELLVSPSTYIRNYRLARARDLLSTGRLTVAEVAYCVGFEDTTYFTEMFREMYRVPPSAYLHC